MRISDILRAKGEEVATVPPNATVVDLVGRLAEHNVGAMVVCDEGGPVAGIVSERDVVRRLHEHGPGVLDLTVEDLMTTDVHTCGPHDTVADLMALMTRHRIRHVPVVVDGQLRGIVSIGDVVKSRMDELEHERHQLEAYISGS